MSPRKLSVTPEQRADSADTLRDYFPVGTTAHTILRHVSQSGMTRDISVIGTRFTSPNGNTPNLYGERPAQEAEPVNLSWHVARVLDLPLSEPSGSFAVRVGGSGMDMGFHLVYSLSRALYGDAVGQDMAAADRRDAGYAISQAWL